MDLELVVPTRRYGRAQLYALNKNNPLAAQLLEMYRAVSRRMVDKELERQGIPTAEAKPKRKTVVQASEQP